MQLAQLLGLLGGRRLHQRRRQSVLGQGGGRGSLRSLLLLLLLLPLFGLFDGRLPQLLVGQQDVLSIGGRRVLLEIRLLGGRLLGLLLQPVVIRPTVHDGGGGKTVAG